MFYTQMSQILDDCKQSVVVMCTERTPTTNARSMVYKSWTAAGVF